jgi:hypothetical protein
MLYVPNSVTVRKGIQRRKPASIPNSRLTLLQPTAGQTHNAPRSNALRSTLTRYAPGITS